MGLPLTGTFAATTTTGVYPPVSQAQIAVPLAVSVGVPLAAHVAAVVTAPTSAAMTVSGGTQTSGSTTNSPTAPVTTAPVASLPQIVVPTVGSLPAAAAGHDSDFRGCRRKSDDIEQRENGG